MSLNSLEKIILCKKFWIIISTIMMGIYLYPLLSGHLYIPVYDNLDSNVVWNKILAHSGKIFASNNAIIPNMMNGLPRASYGSEFDLLLWLYYFFEPQTAFIINEFLIHFIAFSGTYLLLSKHVVPANRHYSYLLIFTGTLYFATLPFWSGSGASIASLPLTTYILIDIKNNKDTRWHWLYLIVLPLYSSLILVYMFYLVYAGLYWLYDIIKYKKINYRLLGALVLLGIVFLLKDYRLVYAMFIDNGFVSHRVEFNVFFNANLFETYRLILVKFLQGHTPHAGGLQQLYLIPISVSALILSLSHRRFSKNESMLIWLMLVLSFAFDVWNILLVNKYSMPIIVIISLVVFITNKRYRDIAFIFMLILSIDLFASLFQYSSLKWLTDYLPILKSLNIVRFYFVEPFLLTLLLAYTLKAYVHKLSYAPLFVLLFVITQFIFSLQQSFYKTKNITNELTFSQYYAPKLFTRMKRDLTNLYPDKPLTRFVFINYGIEPAIALYNGLYTVDGYSTNYPLSYKKRFRKTQDKILDLPIMKGNRHLYDEWGSKVYLMGLDSRIEHYKYFAKTTSPSVALNADVSGICRLGTDFLIASHPLKNVPKKYLKLLKKYRDTFWQLWLYKINCNFKKVPIIR